MDHYRLARLNDGPDWQTCTVTLPGGRFCDKPVPDDAPVSNCKKHLAAAYLYMENLLAEANREHHVVPWTQPSPKQSVVYYIQFGDRVKIGTTVSLTERLASLPYDRLLGYEPGDVYLERQRQRQFARYRIRGEWFHAVPELIAHARQCDKARRTTEAAR